MAEDGVISRPACYQQQLAHTASAIACRRQSPAGGREIKSSLSGRGGFQEVFLRQARRAIILGRCPKPRRSSLLPAAAYPHGFRCRLQAIGSCCWMGENFFIASAAPHPLQSIRLYFFSSPFRSADSFLCHRMNGSALPSILWPVFARKSLFCGHRMNRWALPSILWPSGQR